MAKRKNILIILAIIIIALSAIVIMVGSAEEIKGFLFVLFFYSSLFSFPTYGIEWMEIYKKWGMVHKIAKT